MSPHWNNFNDLTTRCYWFDCTFYTNQYAETRSMQSLFNEKIFYNITTTCVAFSAIW